MVCHGSCSNWAHEQLSNWTFEPYRRHYRLSNRLSIIPDSVPCFSNPSTIWHAYQYPNAICVQCIYVYCDSIVNVGICVEYSCGFTTDICPLVLPRGRSCIYFCSDNIGPVEFCPFVRIVQPPNSPQLYISLHCDMFSAYSCFYFVSSTNVVPPLWALSHCRLPLHISEMFENTVCSDIFNSVSYFVYRPLINMIITV